MIKSISDQKPKISTAFKKQESFIFYLNLKASIIYILKSLEMFSFIYYFNSFHRQDNERHLMSKDTITTTVI